MKKEELEMIYDNLYQLADLIIKKYNPCQGEGKNCIRGENMREWCCEGCKFTSESGCTTQNLRCKLWVCNGARLSSPKNKKTQECLKMLDYMNYIASALCLGKYRGNREEVIKYAQKRRFNG